MAEQRGGPDLVLDTLVAPGSAEIEVRRSRFLATVHPVTDEDEAAAIVADVRRAHHDARHHATALVLGPDGRRERSNDDGEPSGTAGAPMLAVLRGAALTDVVAVVTRWFGGTLLGTGGLTRAYGDAVAAALAVAERRSRLTMAVLVLRVGHDHAGRVEHRLRTWAAGAGTQVQIGAADHDATGASYDLAVVPGLVAGLRDLLASSGIPHELSERPSTIRDVTAT